MWAIWDFSSRDWLREMPSKVDDGGHAVLVFFEKQKAAARAAKNYGYERYESVEADGWCKVVKIGSIPADVNNPRRKM